MRKIYVDVTVRLIIAADDGTPINHVLENMDYGFTSTEPDADIIETEIKDWNITDSK